MQITILLISGFILLIVGAEVLVRSASRFAAIMGMTPLVIGLTVVALGTSSPELAISIQSALSDSSDLAVGNAVGSNILNTLLILGICSLVLPLAIKSQVVKIDVPFMVVATVTLLVVAWDGMLSRLEGIGFIVSLLLYIGFQVAMSRKQTRLERERVLEQTGAFDEVPTGFGKLTLYVLAVILGLGILAAGCTLFVDGSVRLAKLIGMSELIIGLTVVSVGTSLPELVTCLIASYKGEREMAVGSIVGSNLFNILGVLGVTAIITPQGLAVPSQALYLDIPVAIFAVVICLPIFFTGAVISRREGAVMMGLYLVYVTYLILRAG